jgi:poly-gamma-glutamate synthesis protein (capsule biosynthesis protein)
MIKINITGDFYVSPSYINDFINEDSISDEISHFFRNADLNITNLEAPIVSKETPREKFGPNLFTSEKCVPLLKRLNISMVTLANNHIMDQGDEGLYSTLEVLNDHGIGHLGANSNLVKASDYFIKNIEDLKIGFLNIAENEFSNTTGDYPGAAPLDIMGNTLSIQNLKKRVDKVILIIHGGTEMHTYPSPRFKKTLRYFAEQGADAIIAHHTHRYNGFEIYNDIPIVYGTGNFIFPKLNSDFLWNLGVIAHLGIEKNKPITLEIIPISLEMNAKINLSFLSLENNEKFKTVENDKKEVIKDDNLIEEKYALFVKNVENQYLHFLQPYSSKYLHKLFSLGILPNFLKHNKKRLLYLNLIRCEAHRDVLLRILKN